MSGIDPDTRERWAEVNEQRRAQCTRLGCTYRGMAGGPESTTCLNCGNPNPQAQKPRITLTTGEYRSVHDPSKGIVIFEKRDTDAAGAERWVECASPLSSTRTRSEQWPAHLWELLTKGRAP